MSEQKTEFSIKKEDIQRMAKDLGEYITPFLQTKTSVEPLDIKQDVQTAVEQAIKEHPISIIHHDPEEARTCQTCKPKLDAMLNEAQEKGYRIGQAALKIQIIKQRRNHK